MTYFNIFLKSYIIILKIYYFFFSHLVVYDYSWTSYAKLSCKLFSEHHFSQPHKIEIFNGFRNKSKNSKERKIVKSRMEILK